MNENTTVLLLIAAAAYFMFVHKAQAATPPPQTMAKGANSTDSDIKAGLDLVTSIFTAAGKAIGSRGDGVANS